MEDPKKMEEGFHQVQVVVEEKPENALEQREEVRDETKMATAIQRDEESKGGEKPVLLIKEKSKRIATLDAFRGLTIVVCT